LNKEGASTVKSHIRKVLVGLAVTTVLAGCGS
jgi:hypothetical protein